MSRNVIYYLKCNFCQNTSYIGKTDNLRARTNNHITGCRNKNTNIFDNHEHSCAKIRSMSFEEPYFKLFVFIKINDYNKLRNYERLFHSRGYDTMNC